MRLPRWSPLLAALLSISGITCRGKPDPTEAKPAQYPEVSITGVDTSSLTPRERREWAAQVTELLAPCPDVPVNIAQCIQEQRACKTCLPAAQLLLRQVQAGKPKKEREDAFHARFDDKKIRTLVTDGSPEMGSPDAVVTIVEWADFECPFCRMVSPVLESLLDRFEGQVRLVYKFYPLAAHAHAEVASRAAVAALNQGKFWEMHHMLFENQERLEQADLEKYAKQIGLDLVKFRLDLTSKETGERIEKDKKQADEVGLDGTPLIFINGRKVELEMLGANVVEELEDWVKLDIELAGKTPKPPPAKPDASGTPLEPAAPTTSGSAAPTTSGSARVQAPPPQRGPEKK